MSDPASAEARSSSARSEVRSDQILISGHDLTDLMATVGLGQMTWLQLKGRLPSSDESAVFDALLVTLVEHGMTPQALAARMVYLCAPESLQAAMAAGLCGVGSRFGGSIEGVAEMLQNAGELSGDDAIAAASAAIVARSRERRERIPGLGHPEHTDEDPRTGALFEIAAAHGFRGPHVALMERIGTDASQQMDRRLPVNATGALGAVASELGIDWRLCRGLVVVGRAAGLLGHLADELEHPSAFDLWRESVASYSSRHAAS